MVLNRLITSKRHQLYTFCSSIDICEQVSMALMFLSPRNYRLMVRLTSSQPSFGRSCAFDTICACGYQFNSQSKSMDWFLYDRDLRHEVVKDTCQLCKVIVTTMYLVRDYINFT